MNRREARERPKRQVCRRIDLDLVLKGVSARVPDKTLTCRDCGAPFVFTQNEQDFYAEKGFTNEPSRCPACRAARKASRGDGYGGGGGYGRSGGQRQMYPAVCSRCGKDTEVPFQPTSGKPVYCSDCFQSERGGSSRGGGNRGGSRSSRYY